MKLSRKLNVDTVTAVKDEYEGARVGEKTFLSQYISDPKRHSYRRACVTGPWTNRHLYAQSLPQKHALQVEGSIGPYKSGQNGFTTSNVAGAVSAMFGAVNRHYELGLTAEDKVELKRCRKVRLLRLDYAINVVVPEAVSKQAALMSLAIALLKAGRTVSAYGYGETVYHDQRSQAATIKAYDKELEVSAKGGLPPDLPHRERLLELLHPLLRVELTLRELRLRSPETASPRGWTTKTMRAAFELELNKIDLRKRVEPTLARKDVLRVKAQYRPTYLCWEQGDLMRKLLDPKALKRQAEYFLTEFQIDLYSPPPETTTLKVALGDIFSFENALACPDWLYESELYYEPPEVE